MKQEKKSVSWQTSMPILRLERPVSVIILSAGTTVQPYRTGLVIQTGLTLVQNATK